MTQPTTTAPATDTMTSLEAQPKPTPLPAKTFTPFPKLPKELRLKIWGVALRNPRVVGARLVLYHYTDRNGQRQEQEVLTPTAPNSAILYVNRESRTEAKNALSCVTTFKDGSTYGIPLLYLDRQLDTLWITNYIFSGPRHYQDTNVMKSLVSVANLAFPCKAWHALVHSQDTDGYLARLFELWHFNGVQEVILVVDGDKYLGERNVAMVSPRSIPEEVLAPAWIDNTRDRHGFDYQDVLRWLDLEESTNEDNQVLLKEFIDVLGDFEGMDPQAPMANVERFFFNFTHGTCVLPNFKYKETIVQTKK